MLKNFILTILGICLCSHFAFAQKPEMPVIVRGQIGKKLDADLTQAVDKGFSGALLVAKKGKILLAKGFGFADREKRTPVTTSTIIPIGSLTKQFTAAAILKLETQGKLNVNDYITKYFKDVPPDKSKITIHQLLTHSSGIPSRAGRCGATPLIDEYAKTALSSALDFEPGTQYRYSNSGYALLGAIIKIVSGEPYEQYLSGNLFKPSGMQNTGTFLPKYSVDDIATGYRDGERWGFVYEKLWDYTSIPVTKPEALEHCGLAFGGIFSNIGDLYKWQKALEGEKIFSKAAKQKIFTPYIREGERAKSFYGYGWAIVPAEGRKIKLITHNGDVNGVFQADFRWYVDEDIFCILLTNSLYPSQGAIEVSDRIAKIIFAESK